MDDTDKQSGENAASKRRSRTTTRRAQTDDLPVTGDANEDLVERVTGSGAGEGDGAPRHEHTMTAQERYEAIARIAYFRAQQRQFEPGREVDDWLAAEQEFEQSLQAQAVTQAVAQSAKSPTKRRASGGASAGEAKSAAPTQATRDAGNAAPTPASSGDASAAPAKAPARKKKSG